MGITKNMMIAMDEAIWQSIDVEMDCPRCQRTTCATTDLPTVYEHTEEDFPIEVLCLDCSTVYHGWVQTNWHACDIKLTGYPQVNIKADPVRGDDIKFDDQYEDNYYEWLEQEERLTQPVYRSFKKSIDEVINLANIQLPEEQYSTLTRMLISQCITAMEVYLSDTLIKKVANERIVQEKLLSSKHLDIGQTKYSLRDAIGVANFSKLKLLEHLKRVSFHNLSKVKVLFSVGLEIDFLCNEKQISEIQKAINIRHDCVHRNGQIQSTNEFHKITKEEILALTKLLQTIINEINDKIIEQERHEAALANSLPF